MNGIAQCGTDLRQVKAMQEPAFMLRSKLSMACLPCAVPLAPVGAPAEGTQLPASPGISPLPLNNSMERKIASDTRYRDPPQQPSALELASELDCASQRHLAVASQQGNEHEKRRLSKELYDDLAQGLSVLKLDLGWLEQNLAVDDLRVPERIVQMHVLLDKIILRTKSIAATLRPPLLDDFGLLPAVQWVTDNFQKRTGIFCHVDTSSICLMPGDPAESAIFRVIQEGLLNIERHAQAHQVSLRLRHHAQQVELLLQDDGIGINAGGERKDGCYGLIAMRERITILDGTIRMGNAIGGGFIIHALIPVRTSPHAMTPP